MNSHSRRVVARELNPQAPLFESGEFTLHSGVKTIWRINCDALSDQEISTLAQIAAHKLAEKCWTFSEVYNVPEGGDKLAKVMKQYKITSSSNALIVDDVFTTGESMEHRRQSLRKLHIHSSVKNTYWGLVIFARTPAPWWITPIFQMGGH